MKLIKTVEEGGTAPRGYGVAWRSFVKPEIYCAPLPLNHIIRVWRQIHHRVKYPHYFFAGSVALDQYAQWKERCEELTWENRKLENRIRALEDRLGGNPHGTS